MDRDIPWPLRPKPRDGEVLSSWLARIAEGYGLSVREFRQARLPKTPGYAIDVDSAPDPAFFEAISRGSMIPVEDVRCMGYAADEGFVYSRVAGTNPEWIVPRSPNHRDSIPFCPSCLATDAIPYYRKRWRYAFAPVCSPHGLLSNHCPSCGAPYGGPSLSGSPAGPGSSGCCSNCLRRFRPVTITGIDDQALSAALAAQDQIFAGLSSGWVQIGGTEVHVCMYLRGLHDLVLALLNENHGPKISQWISKESGVSSPAWSLGSLESQPAAARAMALGQATWLVGEWPTRITRMVSELDLRTSAIRNEKGATPNWLLHPDVVRELGRQSSVRSKEEIASARDVLRKKRKWAPNDAEVDQFMRTGEQPPIRPLSRAVPEDLKDRIAETDGIVEDALQQRAASRDAARPKPRELYPALGHDILAREPLEDLDDASERLTALADLRRKERKKPTSG